MNATQHRLVMLLLADDITLTAETPAALQHALNTRLINQLLFSQQPGQRQQQRPHRFTQELSAVCEAPEVKE